MSERYLSSETKYDTMIDEERTLEIFGYTSSGLSQSSKEKVVVICDECGRHRVTRKDICEGLCRACASTIGNKNMPPDTRAARSAKQSTNAKSRSPAMCKKIQDACQRAKALPAPARVAEQDRFLYGSRVDRILTIERFGYDPIHLSKGSGRQVVLVCAKCMTHHVIRMSSPNKQLCKICAFYKQDFAVRNIDDAETFKRFGYHAYDLSPAAHKKVVGVCIGCGARRVMDKSKCDYKLYCQACGTKNRDQQIRVPDYNVYSIDDKETFNTFGHHATELAVRSGKRVIAVCIVCGKSRAVDKCAYTDMCHLCAANDMEKRIECSCRMRGIEINDFDGFSQYSGYCDKFNDDCKERNRRKYGRICFVCGKDELANGKRLCVHHVDMSKTQGCDGEKWKLVPLCQSCHGKAHNSTWQARIEYLRMNVWEV